MKKINKPLTKSELMLLSVTTDRDLKNVFPNHSRKYLRDIKNGLIPISEQVKADKKIAQEKAVISIKDKKYDELLKENKKIISELDAIKSIGRNIEVFKILPSPKLLSEATAFLIASDWHYEEEVVASTVNGLNSFNLNIANKRIEKFFQNSLKLIKMAQQDVTIKNIVLALLGDFISGNIHEDILMSCKLQPIIACREVQKQIASGIDFLLENTDCDLVIPCCVGNHSRITKGQMIANEIGNALETGIYGNLAWYYEKNKRVKFILQGGYHVYLDVYDKKIRFHHGHDIRYMGGIGGLYIPVNKAIAQWNKGIRADIDVFGHWHQSKMDGHFISNGSLIGYNAYAISIKADYEDPQQIFFLIDKERGRTVIAPILLNKN